MSTATRQPPPQPAADWIPKPLARLTIDQYEAMVDSGVFTKRDRFHLINGLLVAKVSKNPLHVLVARNVRDELARLVPSGWDFGLEAPVRLPPWSEPEPDVSMARGSKDDYATHHPGPADLALVVEVAESSISQDREMVNVYGPAGIPVYWIVNLKARQVEVYTLKRRGGYGKPRVFKPGQSVPVVIGGAEVGRIAVSKIIPRIAPLAGANGA
jgi:Uma2 family endonuclease